MFARHPAVLIGAALTCMIFVVSSISAEEMLSTSHVPPADLSHMQRIKRELVAPPFVHSHEQAISRDPAIIEFEMDIIEQEMQIAEDAFVQAMTFEGTMPGPLLVVHEGDYVELTLYNRHDNLMQHNIDFHSATL